MKKYIGSLTQGASFPVCTFRTNENHEVLNIQCVFAYVVYLPRLYRRIDITVYCNLVYCTDSVV